MTVKGILKAALVAAGAGTLVVYGPVVLAVAAGVAVAGHVGAKVVAAAGRKLGFIRSNKTNPVGKGEKLTAGEAAAAESIFGKKMRPERVKKYFSSTEADVPAQTFGPRTVKFFGEGRREADFSKTENIDNAVAFIGQMAHVFPAQNQGVLTRAFRQVFLTHKSEYQLTAKSRFGRFGNQQQQAIIQDYARQFIYRDSATTDLGVEQLTSLKHVVEKSFPQARRTRLAVETQRTRNGGTPVKPEAVRFPVVIH